MINTAADFVADISGSLAAVLPEQRWFAGKDRPVRAVNGLITGWHDAGASHLLLLEAVAGADLVGAAYRAAVPSGYLWHEFGDSTLLLPSL